MARLTLARKIAVSTSMPQTGSFTAVVLFIMTFLGVRVDPAENSYSRIDGKSGDQPVDETKCHLPSAVNATAVSSCIVPCHSDFRAPCGKGIHLSRNPPGHSPQRKVVIVPRRIARCLCRYVHSDRITEFQLRPFVESADDRLGLQD
jgi:hypothetical protein